MAEWYDNLPNDGQALVWCADVKALVGKLSAADEAWHEQEDELQSLRSRLDQARKILEADLVTSGCATCHELGRLLSVSGVERQLP